MESALPRSTIMFLVLSIVCFLFINSLSLAPRSTPSMTFSQPLITNSNIIINGEVLKDLTLTIKPEKRVPPTGNDSVWAQFSFLNGTTVVYSTTGTTTNAGVITFSDISPATLPTGTYFIKVKGLSHLTRKFSNVFISDQQLQSIDLSAPQLKAGDAHPSSDDYINGLDISYLGINLYGSDLRADQNRDGLVNSLDFSITLDNLYQYGDQ